MESATVRFLCDDDENHGVESHRLSKVVTSVTVHEVQENGTERLRLRASGAVPATSTHGTAAPPQAPTRHTHQRKLLVQVGLNVRAVLAQQVLVQQPRYGVNEQLGSGKRHAPCWYEDVSSTSPCSSRLL